MGACVACGCQSPAGGPAHAIAAALAVDDLDAAMEFGLPEATPCPDCTPACAEMLLHARGARLRALAARERFRARNARLERRARARAAARTPASPVDVDVDVAAAPALPPAAAAALARAKAKAAGRAPQ